MARLFVQFLVIYNNEKLPNCIYNLPKYFHNSAQGQINKTKGKDLKMLSMLRIFVISGHTESDTENSNLYKMPIPAIHV